MGVFAALQFLPVSAAQDNVRIQGRPAAVGLKIEDPPNVVVEINYSIAEVNSILDASQLS